MDCGFDGVDGGHDGALSLTVGDGVDHHGGVDFHGIADGGSYHGLSIAAEVCAAAHSFDGIHDATWGNATQNISPWNGVPDAEKNIFRVHVVPHGPIDTCLTFAGIASAMGFVKVSPPLVDMQARGLKRTEQTLLPLTAWNPAVKPEARPAGYFEGATGETVLWREFWQVGFKPWPWSTPIYDKNAMVHLEVVSITWFYREAGDHETLFAIRVIPRTWIDPVSGASGFREQPLTVHRTAAGKAVKALFAAVGKAELHPASQLLRSRVMSSQRKATV